MGRRMGSNTRIEAAQRLLGADLGVHAVMLTLLVGVVARLYPSIIN